MQPDLAEKVDEVAQRVSDVWHIQCAPCLGISKYRSHTGEEWPAICGVTAAVVPIHWSQSPCPMCHADLPKHVEMHG